MGGVDVMDQKTAAYRFPFLLEGHQWPKIYLKNRKWYEDGVNAKKFHFRFLTSNWLLKEASFFSASFWRAQAIFLRVWAKLNWDIQNVKRHHLNQEIVL